MLGYILKRLLYAVPVTLAVSIICFSLVQLAPGDPLSVVLPADASQEMIDQTRAQYGLDKPLPAQYLVWLGNVLQGDLGTSIATGRSVASEIGNAIGYTMSVAVLASILALVVGLTLGLIAGYSMGSPVDRIASATAISGVSVPHYWLGIVLVVVFSVNLGWLPAMGAGRSGQSIGDALQFMVLPVLTMAAMPAGIITRSVRALVAEKLGQEFVTALRAKGLSSPQIFVHVIKNAAPTALAVIRGTDGLFDGRLDPRGDGVCLARDRAVVEQRHPDAGHSPVAGHHPCSGLGLRRPQFDRRYFTAPV